jgi:hypothetical protein
MKSKTKIRLIALVMLMLACSIFEVDSGQKNGDQSNSTSTSKSTFTDKSEVVVIELEVKSDIRSNVLKIDNIKLDEGKIELRLLNPKNEIIREEMLVSPTKYNERFDLEIIPGLWILEMDLDDASSSYNIKWEAKN